MGNDCACPIPALRAGISFLNLYTALDQFLKSFIFIHFGIVVKERTSVIVNRVQSETKYNNRNSIYVRYV